MSKRGFLGLIVLFIGIFLICYFMNISNKVERIVINGKTVSYETLDEMDSKSDVIVEVTRSNVEEVKIFRYGDAVSSGFTFSTVIIDKIHKDKTQSISIGQSITILENEFTDPKTKIVYHVAGYSMMQIGDKYLLFLEHNIHPDGLEYFVSLGVNYGKIAIDPYKDIYYVENAQNDVVKDTSLLKNIWKSARDKYLKY